MVSPRRTPYAGSRKKGLKPKLEKALVEGDADELFKALTPRQSAFAQEYIKDFNGQAAAQRAGYTGANLNKQAHQMLTHPGIRRAIDTLLEERNKNLNVDIAWVVRKLTRTLERCETEDNFNPTAVLRSAELLGKYLGMFIDRQEISGPDGEAIKLEQKIREDANDFAERIKKLSESSVTPTVVPLKVIND